MNAHKLVVGGFALFTLVTSMAAPAASDGARPAGASQKASRYGPLRTELGAPLPKHSYSPFAEAQRKTAEPKPTDRDYARDRILFKLAPRNDARLKARYGAIPDEELIAETLARHHLKNHRRVFGDIGEARREAMVKAGHPDLTRWQRAVIPAGQTVDDALKELRGDPAVEIAEPDLIRRMSDLPDASTDPRLAEQWHLAAIQATNAWAYLESQGLPPGGSPDVVVAVIDSGVDLNHPDLAANLWTGQNGEHGRDVITGSNNPMDDNGHGTHVAGIIAATGLNQEGGVGVAYGVKIMAIKAAQYSGVLTVSDIAAAIYYAVDHGADVINMSFGGYFKSQVEEDALAVAFGQAVLVASAGNDGLPNETACQGKPAYPAAYNWVLGVMASDETNGYALFSNFDCTPGNLIEYEILAPGVSVLSTLPGSQYAAWSGTSMAAPIVSGIAALVRTKFPDKNIYSSRFIMGQLAAQGNSTVVNALSALTYSPQPNLAYLQHWLFDQGALSTNNNNNGIVNSGETIDLAIVLQNRWGKADQVSVTIEPRAPLAVEPDPYITMLISNVDYGSLGSFSQGDNGLTNDSQGAIAGVARPFRFRADASTPNDHLIPFHVTMTGRNGLNTNDPTLYSFTSDFRLVVQRGRELPRIITNDMVLTKEDYWIIPGPTLVPAGVTLRITEGAQVQFNTTQPSDPYATPQLAYLQIQGRLLATGTADEPVEMFLDPLALSYDRTEIRGTNGPGGPELRYVRIENPAISVALADHCEFWGGAHGESPPEFVRAEVINSSILRKLGLGASTSWLQPFRFLPWNLNAYYDNGTLIPPPYPITGSLLGSLVEDSFFDMGLWSGEDFGNGRTNTLANNVFVNNARPGFVSGISASDRDTAPRSSAGLARNNAFLNDYSNPNPASWVQVRYAAYSSPGTLLPVDLSSNYWGTTSPQIMDALIWDYEDDFNLPRIVYAPILSNAPSSAYPFVAEVQTSSDTNAPGSLVGPGPLTVTVRFNRDMATNQPSVSFGPAQPFTDFTVRGGWSDARTWVGTFNVTPLTGDGYQFIRVAGAVAADDPWLVTANDVGRFRFEIRTAISESLNLQANGGEGFIDLSWTQDDFDLLAGFNLYRSTATNGAFSRINPTVIPLQQRNWRDSNVTPGQTYFYKFTVVKTDFAESDFSNLASAAPLDTIPPVITHTPLTSAQPGLPLTIVADVTDNVRVQGVTLFFRAMGTNAFLSRAMTRTTGNRYAATIEGSRLVSPGLEYYLEATDGITVVRAGRPEAPYPVLVNDRPVITAVTPNQGSAAGGTPVTIGGANFKSGVSVSFGGEAATNVAVVNSSQINCVTPPHFPAAVDVTVVNPDNGSGTALNAYTFQSDTVSLSLPDTSGAQQSLVSVPINAANLNGVAAASLTVAFDAAIVSAQTARPGNVTPGWVLAVNTNTPGQIRISMASPGPPASGAGILAYLDFEVVGLPNSSTTLQIASVSLNDGAVPVQAANGSLTVNRVFNVGGIVRFWNGSVGVPGVTATLLGNKTYSGTSGTNGGFTVAGAEAGDYALSLFKSDEANGITAYDASLVLQHDAGLITLTGSAATAADVNQSGQITAFDAFYILQKAVDSITLPFPGAGKVWEFQPASRAVQVVAEDLSGQDFTAILLGDVSGNWAPGVGIQSQAPVTVALKTLVTTHPPSTNVWLLLKSPEAVVYGIDLTLEYDSGTTQVRSIQPGPLGQTFATALNTNQAGRVRAALASAVPLQGIGGLLLFDVGSSPGTGLQITNVSINEGLVAVEIDSSGAAFDLDSDGDGQVDWPEIRAGTDPASAQSFFGIKSVSIANDGARVIRVFSIPDKVYQLQFKNRVSELMWLNIGTETTATGALTPLLDLSPAQGHRLYRVQLVE